MTEHTLTDVDDVRTRSRYLAFAANVATLANSVRPGRMKGELVSIATILAGSVLMIISAIVVAGTQTDPSDSARLLIVFVLFGGVGVALTALTVAVFVVWRGYVHQYVLALDAREEAMTSIERLDEVRKVLERLGQDPAFAVSVVDVVLARVRFELAAGQIRIGDAELESLRSQLVFHGQLSQSIAYLVKERVSFHVEGESTNQTA